MPPLLISLGVLAPIWAVVATGFFFIECRWRLAAERREKNAWDAVRRLNTIHIDSIEADRKIAASLREIADDLDPPDED